MKRNKKGFILAAVSVALWVVSILMFAAYRERAYPEDLVPVEEITGIYTPATLNEGCYIESGMNIPMNGNDPWIHNIYIGIVSQDGPPKGYVASDIRIIDVYGDKCTIVYPMQDTGMLVTYDYPLENLEYNERIVAKADDGVKEDLYGKGFSLQMSENKGSEWGDAAFCFSLPAFLTLVAIYKLFIEKEEMNEND